MFAFISILQFLVIIETDKNELLYRQFKQSSHDLKNVSKLIIGTEKVHFLKKFNFKEQFDYFVFQSTLLESHFTVKKQATGRYTYLSTYFWSNLFIPNLLLQKL